jgi:hypothetical protein
MATLDAMTSFDLGDFRVKLDERSMTFTVLAAEVVADGYSCLLQPPA